ncbi:restriction endonuclease subunit S [Frateuria terrea]|uniref:Type I restriction enzyme, S subunit n=1 Tax=Frateuria terrea TaxID=529704 RepID=A0A1H6X827_9GAMM|nr:restriction endonuclease subunit S [Frateuria terrea]SEJ25268.1 type I restriction enzyme, S subunit [Frateuria terrea]SFP59855.1 type I restriction enzyme, S subunit [Frateuria terrea]
MSVWPKVKLKDLCERVTVGYVGPMAQQYVPSGVPFLRSLNVRPYRISLDKLMFIDEAFHHKIRKSALRPGDVAIVRTGYPGVACVVPESLPRSNCSDLVIVRPSKELNPHFLCAIFNSTFGRDVVAGNLVGAAQQHFNITVAKELVLSVPEKAEQDEIAAVLVAYDDLIENNRRRIALLERMAEQLYREWFVRFRFPEYRQAKFEKGKPVGWSSVPVAKAFRFTGGATPSKDTARYWKDGTINWFTPSDITAADGLFLGESGLKCTEEGLSSCSATLFPAYSVMMTSRATIGAIGINTTPACTNQGFIACLPNERYPLSYLYHWLKLSKDYFLSLCGGATFPELTKGTFKRIEVLTPPSSLVAEFDRRVAPIFSSMEKLERVNAVLAKTRDLLLPRLISGKLRVDQLDIQFPPSMPAQA